MTEIDMSATARWLLGNAKVTPEFDYAAIARQALRPATAEPDVPAKTQYLKVTVSGDLYVRLTAAATRFASRNAAVSVFVRRGLARGVKGLAAPRGVTDGGVVLMVPLAVAERTTLQNWAAELQWTLTDVIRALLERELRTAG
ncbi:hypothetical protein KPL74_11050 [Bacillus sp. NP157]|nr:hypothetical protein KPL74_11050 [Bacillus sp. NP157]